MWDGFWVTFTFGVKKCESPKTTIIVVLERLSRHPEDPQIGQEINEKLKPKIECLLASILSGF